MNGDLISRSALVRFGYTHLVRVISGDKELGTKRLSEIPAVDAVEVVRCRYCVNWKKAKMNSQGYLICPVSGMKIMADRFCSYGERRADNAD